jgi:hypothetical protein
MEEKAQVSFEYLLTAVFSIIIAVSAALMIEALRTLAFQAQSEIMSVRARVIENIMTN